MAIRQAQSKIPEHLPAAHLMLDDIEQLTAILSGTAKRDNYGHSRAQVKYIVDGVTECDNIDDLKRLGSKHHEFVVCRNCESRIESEERTRDLRGARIADAAAR